MKGNKLLEDRDTLTKESIPKIPTWHRSALYVLLVLVTLCLACYSAMSVLNMSFLKENDFKFDPPPWLWDAFKLIAYAVLVFVAYRAGRSHLRVLRWLSGFRRRANSFEDSVNTVGPFLN